MKFDGNSMKQKSHLIELFSCFMKKLTVLEIMHINTYFVKILNFFVLFKTKKIVLWKFCCDVKSVKL